MPKPSFAARPRPGLQLLASCCLAFGAIGGFADESKADDAPNKPQPKPAAATEAAGPEFNAQVAPIFRKHCNGCHNADEPEGGLNLETHEALLKGGKRGAAVVPGDADRSRLLRVLRGAAPKMPPEGSEPPSEAEYEILRAWVLAGARGPDGAAVDPYRLTVPSIPPRGEPRQPISAVAWSPDGKRLALGGQQGVQILDARTRETLHTLGGQRGNVNALAWLDNQRVVAAAGQPGLFGEAAEWKLGADQPARRLVGHRDSLYAAAPSPDGKLLATGSYDEKIRLWNLADGAELRTLEGHNGAVFDLAFHPQSRLLASASGDRTVKLWDAADGRRLDTFGQFLKEVYAVAFSPDGRFLAAGGVDNRIRLYQISSTAAEGTNPLLESRFAHQGPIVRLAWSPTGDVLASASEDGTVKLWDVPRLTQKSALPAQPDWASALSFSPDGKRLLAGRLDGSYAVYDAANGKEIGPAPPPVKPELGSLWPPAVQRGGATRVLAQGKGLEEVTAVKASHAGITGQFVSEGSRPEAAWFELTAQPGVPLGRQELWIETAGGQTARVELWVDDLVQTVEPADAAVVALEMPRCVWGRIERPGDVDSYSFQAAAGQTLVFELAAASLKSKLDGLLTIVDAQGRAIVSSNRFLDASEPLLAFTAPTAGTYTLRVSDLALQGSGNHYYRLAAGDFPYVAGTFPLSVAADRPSEVALTGFNLPADARASLPAVGSGEVAVPLPPGFRSRGPVKVLVAAEADVLEVEPNDRPEQAAPLSVPGTAAGRLHKPADAASGEADVDLFRFTAKAGETWIIETQAAQRGSPVDTRIEVLAAQGQSIPRLQLQAVRDSWIEFRPIDSRQIDVRVANWEEMDLNEYLYMQGEVARLALAPRGPDSGFQLYAINGQRRSYFDTSAAAHALNEAIYVVRPVEPGQSLQDNGLPVFVLNYANDDDGHRRLGRDSYLAFTAPADGDYLIRVEDVRGQGGDHYAYRLIVRRPAPGFRVSVGGGNPTVNAGSGKELTFTAERLDGFEGPIEIEVADLPPGFHISQPIRIEPGHVTARAALFAEASAPAPTAENAASSRIIARAMIDGRQVEQPSGSLGRIQRADPPQVSVRLEPAELTMEAGTTITALVKIQRNGFDGAVRFDVQNLPHGTIVDNIGLNGILIPAGQSERQIFISSRPWTEAGRRPFHVVAQAAGNQVSPPVTIDVRPSPAAP